MVQGGGIIPTRDASGNPNGWLLPLWNAMERPELRPEQVYLTVIHPRASKGPHLHLRREQRYYCIRGVVDVVSRIDGLYHSDRMIAGESGCLVIPAGIPSQLLNYCLNDEEAWLINMPSPAWTPEDQDEHPVEDWSYTP